MIVTTIPSGLRLARDWIQRLNDVGLQDMQISVANLKPDEVSMKSLASVEGKLALLTKHAWFEVNVNSVLGISEERTQDVVAVAKVGARYGLQHSVGVLHDQSGILKLLSRGQMQAYRRVTRMPPSLVYGQNGCLGRISCRAGHTVASAVPGRATSTSPGTAVCTGARRSAAIRTSRGEYSRDDIRHEFLTLKSCSPTCTLSWVPQMSMFDAIAAYRRPAVRRTLVAAE